MALLLLCATSPIKSNKSVRCTGNNALGVGGAQLPTLIAGGHFWLLTNLASCGGARGAVVCIPHLSSWVLARVSTSTPFRAMYCVTNESFPNTDALFASYHRWT